MDRLDRDIVNALQDGLPVCEHPFARAAERLGLSQQCLIQRVRGLLDSGVLSRFGPMYDAERMGGAFHLCAMQVPPGEIESVAAKVNAHPEVAHNYEREHALNVWFVLASDEESRISQVIALIEDETGHRVYDMPKLTEYYVGLRLQATGTNRTPRPVAAN
ncbi:MAG: AsnC family transcriptional regulator [Gammaproteobacteria bacterium]